MGIPLQSYDRRLRRDQVRFGSASFGPPAQVTFYATVVPEMANKNGTLHGGCAATLIDSLSSTLLVGLGQPGRFSLGGITRALDLKFLRAVPVGVEIAIVCEIVHVGRRLALLKAEIRRRDTGDVCVVGEHDKANTDPVDSAKI